MILRGRISILLSISLDVFEFLGHIFLGQT